MERRVEDFDRQPSFTRRQWQLLDAAVRLLDRVGISGFTMRSLADETGLSPMAAYKHFENQRALQLELWRFCQNHSYDTLLEAASDASDPATAFLDLCDAFMRYAVQYPFRFELLYNHPFVREVQTIDALEELRQSVWTFALELVRRAQNSGLFRDDVPAPILLASSAAQVRGLAAGLVYSDTGEAAGVPPEELIAWSVQLIRAALTPR